MELVDEASLVRILTSLVREDLHPKNIVCYYISYNLWYRLVMNLLLSESMNDLVHLLIIQALG